MSQTQSPMRAFFMRVFAVVFVAGGCAGGSSGSNGGTGSTRCRSVCQDMCTTLEGCQIDTGSTACVEECVGGLSPRACEVARPANQLTCDELKEVMECATYCATICRRATECGTFDEGLCVEGCATDPYICNPASVAARTCDQMKPEMRMYEDAGRAFRSGSDRSFGVAGLGAFGLCRSPFECTPPLGCSVETNVCSACTSDADCGSAGSPSICSPQGECGFSYPGAGGGTSIPIPPLGTGGFPGTGGVPTPPGPVCGDGVISGAEQCDGQNIPGTCQTISMGACQGGYLICTASCVYDLSACICN